MDWSFGGAITNVPRRKTGCRGLHDTDAVHEILSEMTLIQRARALLMVALELAKERENLMHQPSRDKLFMYWRNHSMTPERVLDNFSARQGLTEEQKDQLDRILAYAKDEGKRTGIEEVSRGG